MLTFKIILSSIIILALSLLYLGCTPSSYSIRYKNNLGLETFEDSLKAGLVTDSTADMIYFSQVQDTSSEFQDWEND